MDEEKTHDSYAVGTDATPPALAGQGRAPAASPFADQPPRRTTGLRLFDVFLYPFLTNFVVFGLSVVATYLTSKGGQLNPKTGKPLFGKIGQFFESRGHWMDRQFTSMGMNKQSAEMSRMVFFSFADGTLVAPLVKVFEDRREKIGKWIDDSLGTTPTDLSVYKAEPKQTWGSVIAGRFATVAIVVPTAVALDKLHINQKGVYRSLNDVMFRIPGTKAGEWAQSQPGLAKKFGSLDLPELFKVGYFEAFYTSVCTAGLYFVSRFLAKKPGHTEPAPDPVVPPTHTHMAAAPAPANAAPALQLAHAAHEGRLAGPREQAASLS